MSSLKTNKMTNYRWVICSMLFFATTVNYMDRQVLSLTWKDFIAPEFHWTNSTYGDITAWFSVFYAVAMLFAGRFVDWMGTKKGYIWAIIVWSAGACAHAFCGLITQQIVSGQFDVTLDSAQALRAVEAGSALCVAITTCSLYCFLAARFVLAVGEAGNFPAAIKVTAEYFPKKDRAFATSIFNSGASIGALIAPITIPLLAKFFGWEMAFIVIGALGFVWAGLWLFLYTAPSKSTYVNQAELVYIEQDKDDLSNVIKNINPNADNDKLSFIQCFKYRQTWAFAFGKFMTDGVWWFFLFWTPAYLSDVYGYTSDSTMGMLLIFVLYLITMLSIYGGKLPTIIINRTGMNPYAARMRAMLIFAFFPLLALLAQPLGQYSVWFPIVIIGIAGAAHQSWSANIFSTIGDMFPKSAIATITGIGGMAGGFGSYFINKGSGHLFDYAMLNWSTISGKPLIEVFPILKDGEYPEAFKEWVSEDLVNRSESMTNFMKYLAHSGEYIDIVNGISGGYMIIFGVCAVAYLIGWVIMKTLVPKYKPIVVE